MIVGIALCIEAEHLLYRVFVVQLVQVPKVLLAAIAPDDIQFHCDNVFDGCDAYVVDSSDGAYERVGIEEVELDGFVWAIT